MAKKRETVADLRHKVLELEAQLAHVYHFADAELHKAGDGLMGSGVIMQLTALGGRALITPVCIKDGLSGATISAIRADLRRSYDLTVRFKPKAETT